jgi:hypothetical protein
MALRAFLTRRHIFATEFRSPYVVHHVGGFTNAAATRGHNLRFRELTEHLVTPSQETSAHFNPPIPSNIIESAPSMTQGQEVSFQLVRGMTKVSFQVNPWDGTILEGLGGVLPFTIYVRVIGVRTYQEPFPATVNLAPHYQLPYVPAYHGRESPTSVFLSDDTLNLLTTEDQMSCFGDQDWLRSRYPDYTQTNQFGRVQSKRLIYDKIFKLAAHYRLSTELGTNTDHPLNAPFIKTLVIKWPARTVKTVGVTCDTGGTPNVQAALKQQDRFYMAVTQVGNSTNTDQTSDQLHCPGATVIVNRMTSKWWYTNPDEY